jgi:hypothetical protein
VFRRVLLANQPDVFMDIILADTDVVYTSLLADRLKQWRRDIAINDCHDPAKLRDLIAEKKAKYRSVIFLYNATDFVELKHLATSDIWPKYWKAIPILPTDSSCPPSAASSDLSINRFDPVQELIRKLDEYMAENANHTTIKDRDPVQQSTNSDRSSAPCRQIDTPRKPDQTYKPESREKDLKKPFPQADQDKRLWMVLSLTGIRANLCGGNRLSHLVRDGKKVIYLPLMPTYYMDHVRKCSKGHTLSELLLQLIAQKDLSIDISCYWQAHPDGYLFFRPPERADDLVTCDPDILRRLTLALKKKIENDSSGQMVALIHCIGMPFASISAISVLCDMVEIDLPSDNQFSSEAALSEAGHLLASLPVSCDVLKHVRPALASGKGGQQTASALS